MSRPPKPLPKPLPQPSRLEPIVPDVAEAAAIKALFRGDATPDQQHRGMEFICVRLCGARRRTFDPSSARASDFAEGQRDIAIQLTSIRDNLDIRTLKQDGKDLENG